MRRYSRQTIGLAKTLRTLTSTEFCHEADTVTDSVNVPCSLGLTIPQSVLLRADLWHEAVDAGGLLMSYGDRADKPAAQVPYYVDRMLKDPAVRGTGRTNPHGSICT
jgi:hypothetical protein